MVLSLDEGDISLSAASPLILLFPVVTNERKYCLTQQVIIVENTLSREVVLAGYRNATEEGSRQLTDSTGSGNQGSKDSLLLCQTEHPRPPRSGPLQSAWAIARDLGI